jgi:hypothetical protein
VIVCAFMASSLEPEAIGSDDNYHQVCATVEMKLKADDKMFALVKATNLSIRHGESASASESS